MGDDISACVHVCMQGVVSRDLTEGRKLGDTCVGWGGGGQSSETALSVWGRNLGPQRANESTVCVC